MKVMIVDDDPHVLRYYKEELEDEQYDVVTASSAKEAMEIFERENPDIVTLDIVMPDMDGISVLRWMKERKPNIPVIMSTAYDYKDDFAVWASEAYVVKSHDMSTLKATIKRLLDKQQ